MKLKIMVVSTLAHQPVEASISVLENSAAAGYAKWEAIKFLESLGSEISKHGADSFGDRASVALVALFEHEEKLVRHASMDLVVNGDFKLVFKGEEMRTMIRYDFWISFRRG